MPFVPASYVNHADIDDAIRRAEHGLSATVVRIRYTLGPDWTGDPSIFFHIVLTDQAAAKPKISDVAQAIALVLTQEVRPEEKGLHAYFNFRSLSELSSINEPAWA